MASPVKRVPQGFHTVTPHLVVRGASEAIEFYKKAFGARELGRSPGPDGKSIMHAMVQIGDSRIFLNDEFPGMGAISPLGLKGSPVTIHLYVEDADRVFQQAVQAGAKVAMPLADQFWGDRYGIVIDPYGHHWSIGSHIKDMTPEEMQKAAAAAFAQMDKHK
jgi:PhnB protein